MRSEEAISSLLRVHRGTACPEELAAITVVVACLAGRTGRPPASPGHAGAQHRRPHPRHGGHGCWAGCWACR
ncbi:MULTISPECIES: acyl-CoA carboxylase subunit epsilon [unclassified Streptomyces]|uniref:acyl-CoA carboxylase subunit epsilon n=1 Tax=unclassified Streptomyces TaxID=2593676 RepID=UPI0034081829|nr:acyl-CoA carboxylase subunit epsilon [Streptomyces polychromogenes]